MNITFTFQDGIIPLPNGSLAKAEEVPTSVWPHSVGFESSPDGPVVVFLDTEEVAHHRIEQTVSMDPALFQQYFELLSERMAPEVAGHSANNKQELENSTLCGCINCLYIFPPSEITEWEDNGASARCINCKGITVIGDASGFPIKQGFLAMMNHLLINRESVEGDKTT